MKKTEFSLANCMALARTLWSSTKALTIALTLIALNSARAQQAVLHNAYARDFESLNGAWHYIVDPYENGYYDYRYQPFDQSENPSRSAFFMNSKALDKTDLIEYNFDESPTMNIPTDWNTADEKLFYYEGTVWFKKSFSHSQQEGKRYFLYFGAVNYKAEVYLNGEKLGTHVGGFTPFHYEVTDQLKEENFVVVKVDNKRAKEAVPTLNTDWWNYGGITRDVKLVSTPNTFIEDYQFVLEDMNSKTVQGSVTLTGNDVASKPVSIEIPELKVKESLTTNAQGIATFNFRAKKMTLWSPESPKTYQAIIQSGDDSLEDQIGFKSIQTEGQKIVLNGEPVFLRGISIHEEKLGGGRVSTKAEAKQLLTYAKELGCNYVRLAHYPHNEHMVRLADEMGIMLWEEIPVYWTIDWTNSETYANAEAQLTRMIQRDKNRAATIIWSMANETPVRAERNDFLTRLATKARSLDPTRLISAALEQSYDPNDGNIRSIDDPYAQVVDVLSFNQYTGWYGGTPESPRLVKWNIDIDKPVLVSEFGAGAKYGFHADKMTRWSEEYQAYLYQETIEMLNRIEQLQGFSPWILMDFRSPRRVLPGIQDNWNRKGLLSEKGEKKMAFSVLEKFYQEKAKQ
ncbi:beta-glucuronidase [Roseivirga pacifica]|uniref:Beta-glucuronidase n=1 Tax=Roseivirga pacifica TaxID=1267423 RepID=A0A1I0Q640_9BACT|nr:glycoside hydrolase family 2 TIM barrel-domain containing protein [Roseivirga pacifica]RKQ43208.1 beta-glucuronidase [Roseivirga pacifica]SEW22411.1 beta-glucuronidase [Roseivirga pacifica]